jgi:hypothetical protein
MRPLRASARCARRESSLRKNATVPSLLLVCVCVCVCVCVPVCQCLCLSVCVCVYAWCAAQEREQLEEERHRAKLIVSVCVCVCVFTSVSFSLSVYLSVCVCVCVCLCLSMSCVYLRACTKERTGRMAPPSQAHRQCDFVWLCLCLFVFRTFIGFLVCLPCLPACMSKCVHFSMFPSPAWPFFLF